MTDGADELRARVVISGRVQGVWFRGTTVEQARRLGLTGWVRNRRDGTVEALFEGERKAVMQIVAWCHRGPGSAHVDNVVVHYEEPTGEFSGFDLRW